MNKMLFIQSLNDSLLDRERIFKLHLVTLHKEEFLNISFIINSYDYDKYLDDKLAKKVEDLVRKMVPDIFKVNISYKKTITEEKYVIKTILDYVYTEFPTVFTFIQSSEIKAELAGNAIKIELFAEKYVYKFCINAELKEKLEQHLDTFFMETPEVSIIEIPNKTDIEIIDTPAQNISYGIKLIEISITDHLLGIVGKKPRYIVEAKESESELVTLCGALSGIREINYKNKEGKFYTFTLNDTTATIDVKFFPRNQKARECGEKLADGNILAIEGPLRYDSYTNSISLFANKVARCEIDYNSINTKPKYKQEKDRYINIFPQPYVNEEQKSLFGESSEQNNDVFKGKTFVVFDLETTGLDANEKITEIGAIKIIDGEMKEVFHTLINPEKPLPKKIIELTGLTDEMLKNAPIFEDVVADFYKFTRNSIFVAHNAQFDVGFVTRQAKEFDYDFDNAVVDTIILAKQNLKLRNYKLKTVCDALDVNLDEAHRALNDAAATANAFKKLMVLKEKW